jgi:hypothetical protein
MGHSPSTLAAQGWSSFMAHFPPPKDFGIETENFIFLMEYSTLFF